MTTERHTAIHEAAHAICAHMMGYEVVNVSLEPQNERWAGVAVTKFPDATPIVDELVVLLAGATATGLILGDVDASGGDVRDASDLLIADAAPVTEAKRKLDQAGRLARELVTRHRTAILRLAAELEAKRTIEGAPLSRLLTSLEGETQ